MISKTYINIDQYIETFPPPVQFKLQQLRKIILKAAPKASEVISYNMPAFKQDKVLVYFAAYENHIGFYPTSSPIVAFKSVLSGYKTSKGAVQFPINEALPVKLIADMVKYRLDQVADNPKKKSNSDWMDGLSAPAKRALQGFGISTVKQLSKYTQKEIMALHGIGPASLPQFMKALRSEKLAFKSKK